MALRGEPEQLAQAYYMAGPIGHYVPRNGSPFEGYWQGKPAFDVQKEMGWVSAAYDRMRAFWQRPADKRYTGFLRVVPGVSGGGTGLQNSFMAAVPGEGDQKTGSDKMSLSLRSVLFHEMGHRFVGMLSGGVGDIPITGATWFAEGMNVHYTRLLMMRFDLAPISFYGEDINQWAARYYTNPYRLTPAAELARIGFSSGVSAGSAQNVAYTRGSLFFADLDAKIRAKSSGKRKLDDVVKPVLARREAGEKVGVSDLIEAFVRELGPSARDEYEAVIVRREAFEPDANAYGPCFERKAKTYEAAGKPVAGYEWVRRPEIPDSECRKW